jgi:hypothetical protein
LTASQSTVLIREDGSYLYTFCSVVDDIEFGITHIIRGEDHVVNAAVQIEITGRLGAVPSADTTAHLSVLMVPDCPSGRFLSITQCARGLKPWLSVMRCSGTSIQFIRAQTRELWMVLISQNASPPALMRLSLITSRELLHMPWEL